MASGPEIVGLMEPEGTLAEFFNSSSVGLAIFDKKLRYRMLNPALAHSNGASVQSHLGNHVRDILGQVAQQVEPAIQHVFATAQSIVNCEIAGALPTKPAGRQWLHTYFPLRDSNGGVAYVGAVVVEKGSDIQVQPKHSESPFGNTVLRSWKEIASYVGACVKTVQRWEKEHKFPIRRVTASKGAVVFAIRDEVDNWLSHGARTTANDRRS